MNKSWFSIVFLTALALLGGCDRPPVVQPSGKTVKLGIVAPFSGTELAKGIEGIKGMKAAIHLQPLLENGDTLEVVSIDDRNNPSLTVEAVSKLAADEAVAAIVLMSSSASALAAGPRADAVGIPVLATVATHTKSHQGPPIHQPTVLRQCLPGQCRRSVRPG